jgi:hypothetical protein
VSGWRRRYSTADVVLAANLAGAGKSAAEITSALRFPTIRATYDLLSRYGISLTPKTKEQACCVITVSRKAMEAGEALAASQEREPGRVFSLVMEEILLSPNTFKELLAAAERRRK